MMTICNSLFELKVHYGVFECDMSDWLTEYAHKLIASHEHQVCVQPPTPAANVALPAFAATAPVVQ